MVQQLYKEKDLPLGDLEKLGLALNKELLIGKDNLTALLQGRRTDMFSLKDLEADGLNIKQLDAKLSLQQNNTGKLELLVHPIYKAAIVPEFLTSAEADALEKGELENLHVEIPQKDGKARELLVEFDPETNEFLVTDTDKIIVPDRVNNETLTAEQKERYKKGKEVELTDGTLFQMKNTEKKGMASNKSVLIVSLLMDGGISYILLKALGALKDKKQDGISESFTEGYNKAFKEMREQALKAQKENQIKVGATFTYKKEQMSITKLIEGANGKVFFRNDNKKGAEISLGKDLFLEKMANKQIVITEPKESIKQEESTSYVNQNSRGYTRSGSSR